MVIVGPLLVVLIVVSVMVAFPWVAAAAAGLLVAAVVGAWVRAHRYRPPVAAEQVEHVSLERRVLLRQARAELEQITRHPNLPPDQG